MSNKKRTTSNRELQRRQRQRERNNGVSYKNTPSGVLKFTPKKFGGVQGYCVERVHTDARESTKEDDA